MGLVDSGNQPWNSEADYQKYILELCKRIDEEKENIQHTIQNTGVSNSKYDTLKYTVDSLICTMERSKKFYNVSKEGEKKLVFKQTRLEELSDKLDKCETWKDIRDLLKQINWLLAKADIFTKRVDSEESIRYFKK